MKKYNFLEDGLGGIPITADTNCTMPYQTSHDKTNSLQEDFEIIMGLLGTTQKEVAMIMAIPQPRLARAIEGKKPLGDMFLRRLSKEMGIYTMIRNGEVTFMLEDWAKERLEVLRKQSKSIGWGLGV